MIDFYYSPTPNGWKVGIMLEECELPYKTHLLQLGKGEQFGKEFLEISPNAKMPAIVDNDAAVVGESSGKKNSVSVFESGAILIYLAEKTGKFLPPPQYSRIEMLEWMFWQAANQGPIAGQLSHFVNYAPDGEDYGRKRYKGEYERNLAVLENRLDDRDYILGEYSIADILAFPWAFIAKPLGVSLDAFPKIAAWRGKIKSRPAVIRAIDLYKNSQNDGRETAESNSLLFNQNAKHLTRS